MNEEPIEITAEVEKHFPSFHRVRWVNGQLVCVSCENNHTVSVDPNSLEFIKGEAVIESN